MNEQRLKPAEVELKLAIHQDESIGLVVRVGAIVEAEGPDIVGGRLRMRVNRVDEDAEGVTLRGVVLPSK